MAKNNSTIAHDFFIGKIGNGSNLFSEIDSYSKVIPVYTIYSYGKHFPIASYLEGEKTVFINPESYSISTSKHKSYVRSAIPHDWKTVHIHPEYNQPKIQFPNLTKSEHRKHIMQNCKELFFRTVETEKRTFAKSGIKFDTEKKREQKRIYDMVATVTGVKNNCIKYLELFGYKLTKTEEKKYFAIDQKAINVQLKHDNQIIIDTEKRILENRKRLEVEAKNNLIDFKNGEVKNIAWKYKNALGNLDYLRIEKDEKNRIVVRTSNNIVLSAIVFCKDYERYLAGEYSYETLVAGSYRFIGESDNVLTIGCHKIHKNDIETIYNELKKAGI